MAFDDQRVIEYIAAPTALDADGVCQAQTTAGAGDLVINGALASGGIATFGEQQRVTLYSAADLRALTFTVYGTSQFGQTVSEAITGPNANTVTINTNLNTVTRIATDGAVGTNVTVGNSNALETPWLFLDPDRPLKGITIELSSGASLTYEVQYGMWSLGDGAVGTTVQALADTTLTAQSASAGVVAHIPLPLIRLKITSFVSGTATLRVCESPA